MTEQSGYFNEDYSSLIPRDHVAEMEPPDQTELMRRWFGQNYEDPAERTPYQSSEGGYIWIYGGPYDAREELYAEFESIVPESVIEELADELNAECPEWAPTPKPEDYDQYIVEDIVQITDHCGKFTQSIEEIKILLETDVEDVVQPVFHRMLFVNIITAMETYLSDVFISTVVPNDDLTRKLVESTPDFQQEKIPLSEVFKGMEEIEDRVTTYLADLVWHRLDRVKPMYSHTLNIEFPGDIGDIHRAILTRHDIVHRNGVTRDGIDILITKAQIEELVEKVREFIAHLDEQVGVLAAIITLAQPDT